MLVFIFKPIFPLNSWIFLKFLSFASFLVVLPKLLRYIRQILFYPMLLIKTLFSDISGNICVSADEIFVCVQIYICVCADFYLCVCRWKYFREYLCVCADEATASWNFSHKAIKPSQPASLIISTIIFWNTFSDILYFPFKKLNYKSIGTRLLAQPPLLIVIQLCCFNHLSACASTKAFRHLFSSSLRHPICLFCQPSANNLSTKTFTFLHIRFEVFIN